MLFVLLRSVIFLSFLCVLIFTHIILKDISGYQTCLLFFKPVSLAMNRSDYMFDTGTEQESSQTDCDNFTHVNIKQIEFNTMASSFAGLSMKLEQLHKWVIKTFCLIVRTLYLCTVFYCELFLFLFVGVTFLKDTLSGLLQ